jgi:hypothetical protein
VKKSRFLRSAKKAAPGTENQGAAIKLMTTKDSTPPRALQRVPLDGARRYLITTEAVEREIAKDGLTKPKAFGVRYVVDAILRQRLGVARIASKRSKPSHLHSRHLKAALGGEGYKFALTWLIGRGLLSTDNVYKVGESARGYAITKRGWRGGIVPVEMTDVQVTRYARARARLKRDSDAARIAEGVPLDYLRFHLGRLSFEAEEVARYFEEMPPAETWQEAEKIHAHAFSAAQVFSQSFTFHRCAAGRLHWAITNMPRGLRSLLRYGGERLVEVDVSSCQPFLAARFYPVGEEERRRYLADVTSGFYERIGAAAGWQGSRDDLKREVLKRVLFGSEEQASGPVWEAFAALYPVLASIIAEGKRKLRPWQGDRDLALRLQGAEAEVFIDGALRRIAEEMPDVPALPLHDCLLTTAGNAAAVEEVLRSEFLRQFGEVPAFSVKAA